MRRIDYYFRETFTGLRRNGLVAFAAIATAFITLLLFGGALLIYREYQLIREATTGNVQVAVYLTDSANEDAVRLLTETLQDLPIVESVDYESKQEAFERFKRLFANQPALINNVTADALPASLRVSLSEPEKFAQVAAALGCELDTSGEYQCAKPGILRLRDHRETLQRLFQVIKVLSLAVLAAAGLMLVSAVALIANTIRVGLFARRKEIAIMRLVGATNWRIRIPFLIEALVESLVGAGTAVVLMFMGKVLFIDQLRNQVGFLPLIQNRDVLFVVPWLVAVAAAVAIVASVFGMRRFLEV
jgi:cell division transport system permease protein